MSDLDMRPGRTWYETATEMLAEQNPQRLIRLAEELESALEQDFANREQSHERLTKTPSSSGLV